ncbi:MAG: hypothetical protein K2J37_02125, partial [Ruminococcus sp.]|nr:hypothetical protein [Ruminococcus sp.]
NIIASVSVIAGVILTYNIVDGYFNLYNDIISYIMFGLFAVLMAVSRIVFPEGFRFDRDGKKIYDVLLLSAWTALLPLSMTDRTAWFFRFISAAIFFAALVKRNTEKQNAAVLFSISATIASFAFMIRPFLNPDESMIRSKITLGIIFLLGIAYRIIWKDFPNISKRASTFIFIISFIGLMIDGIIYDNAGNRIFVLAVTAAILIWSFFIKSKTWFTVSSAALVIITAVSTFRYFNKAGWWIYLLIVGVIFIVIATVNEICRKKGGTVKSELLRHFSDWNW